MNSFHDPQPGETSKLARDQEMAFRIQARRNKLLGTWAAERMHLSPAEAEAYAKGIVQSDFEEWGEEDVLRKVLGDLILAGVDADEGEVRDALRSSEAEARRTLIGPAAP